MVGITSVGKIASGTWMLLVICASSHCAPADTPKATLNDSASDAALIYLDSKNPSHTQPIATSKATNAKFVRVEVTEVQNPKRYALTFEVHYQPKDGAKVYLGNFSLFPADNPGTFIVATQGKVKQGGAIVLTMVIVDRVNGEAPKAKIKSIALISG
jgi:hypothetical protein